MQNDTVSAPQSRVYLDYNATTPHSSLLKSRWSELFEIFGNPSSVHQDARQPKLILREARQKIADLLGCSPLEIVFNSGASEGNNSVFKSVFEESKNSRHEFIVSQVEHPSVMKALNFLQNHGAIVHFIPVNRDGVLDLDFLKSKLSDKTALVSVMFANNETGVMFPIKEISSLAHAVGALMHSDCVQTLGKTEFNFQELNLDYATFSAHKFYGLKGTGFCYIKKMSPWTPLIHGGGQERARRGGTENVIGIAALNIVLDQFRLSDKKISEMRRLRDIFEESVVQKNADVSITAKASNRLSNTSSLVIKDVDGETLLMTLDLKGYSVSTGAACSSGSPEPSPVLISMGLTRAEAQSSLRVSIGWETTEEQIMQFVQVLTEAVSKLREVALEEKKRII